MSGRYDPCRQRPCSRCMAVLRRAPGDPSSQRRTPKFTATCKSCPGSQRRERKAHSFVQRSWRRSAVAERAGKSCAPLQAASTTLASTKRFTRPRGSGASPPRLHPSRHEVVRGKKGVVRAAALVPRVDFSRRTAATPSSAPPAMLPRRVRFQPTSSWLASLSQRFFFGGLSFKTKASCCRSRYNASRFRCTSAMIGS